MVAIFGMTGRSDASAMAGIGQRLRHHGEEEAIWSPGPQATLGWRMNGPAAGLSTPPSVPLAFAGSILNRQELEGLIGRTAGGDDLQADARLLWELYLALGLDGFAQINGQFSVALLDPRALTLVLAVDRWAARPLFFAHCRGRGTFASEYKALLALDSVPARPNLTALAHLQATKYMPAGEGLLADVHPVAPGSWVRLRSDGWEAGAYAPIRLQLKSHQSEPALASDLRDAILAATGRLIGTVEPIGLALSAGLDSTLTLGAIRAVAPKTPIYTFTASYQRDDPDFLLAAETARHFGTIHQEIIISADDLPQLLPELVWAIEDPIAREEMVVYQVLASQAAKHVSLVLYGTLADKLFAGMPRHLLVKIATDLPWLRKPLIEFYNYTQTGREPHSSLGNLLLTAYYRGRHTTPPHVQGAAPTAGDKELVLASPEPLNALLLAALKHPTEVTAMERLHARVGLRHGSIFHDRDVASCAFRIPGRLKIRGWSRKYILRRAAEGILPPHLAARPKGLVRVARSSQVVQVLDAMGDQLLAPEAVKRRGLFDPQEVARLRRIPDGGQYAEDQFHHLWTMLLTEIWARTFVDGRGNGPIALGCGPPPMAARDSSFAPSSPGPSATARATPEIGQGRSA